MTKSDLMSNRKDETIPLNVDENKNVSMLPEKSGLSSSTNSVGTWAEWDKEHGLFDQNQKKRNEQL